MFICPQCRCELVRQPGTKGVFWECPQCHGRAVGLALLRRTIGDKVVSDAWRSSLNGPSHVGRPCPVCSHNMREVTVIVEDQSLTLDVCQRCEFMWFDTAEYEAIPPAPPKPRALGDVDEKTFPPEVRQALALQRVEQMRANQPIEPDGDWKTLPAFLGLPVQMDSEPFTRKPWATWTLSALIVAVSVAAFFHLRAIVDAYGLLPSQPWRLDGLTFITSFFLHGGPWHLIGNVYFLILFGGRVEDFIGRWRWTLLVIASALVGDFADILIDPHQNLPGIGASGGISGLIAFYALKFPHAKLGFLFRYAYVYFKWIQIPAWGAFAIWIALQTWGAYAQIAGTSHVASLAHLGGVSVGLAAWYLWRNLDQKPAAGIIAVKIS